MSPSSSSRWKRVSSRRGAAEHSIPRITSTSRATSIATASSVSASSHAQRDRGRDGAQRPRRRRQQAGERGREAADPHLAARRRVLRGELALQPLELREQRVGVAEQHVRGGA